MAETAPAAQLTGLEAEYARIKAVAATVRTQMLSDRLTRSRKEAQMREANIEEAEDQAAYFEGRTREMERAVLADETELSALEAQAAEIYGHIAAIHIHNSLAAFDDALNGLTPEIDAIVAALTAATPHLQAAFALRDALLPSATDTRAALAAANDRADAVASLLHKLRHEQPAPHPDASMGRQR